MPSVFSKCLVVGIPVTLVFGVVIYYFIWRKDEFDTAPPPSSGPDFGRRQIKVELEVPWDRIAVVIGKNGSNMREVEKTTGAFLKLKDGIPGDRESPRTLEIRGSPVSVQAAERRILKIIAETPPIVTEDFWVPKESVGMIIGKRGETIREISAETDCKIFVNNIGEEKELINLKGRPANIQLAKELISDKIQEFFEFNENSSVGLLISAKLRPGVDKFCEVFVSSVCNPERFWVQNRRASKEIHEFHAELQEFCKNFKGALPKTPNVGEFVAAPQSSDGRFYRAQVYAVYKDENGSEICDLTFVDFGDGADIPTAKCKPLTEYFLRKLPIQAIECRLPLKPKDSAIWSEKCIEYFEKLTNSEFWTPCRLKILNFDEKNQIHTVELWVKNEENEEKISVAEKLIEMNFAEFLE